MSTAPPTYAEQEHVLARWPAAHDGSAHKRAKIEKQNSDGTYGVLYMEDGDEPACKAAPVQYCPAVAASCLKKMPPYALVRRVRESMFGDRLKDTFAACDTDKDGKISRDEFRAAITALDIMCVAEELDAMIAYADLDGDGLLEYHEWLKLFGIGTDDGDGDASHERCCC